MGSAPRTYQQRAGPCHHELILHALCGSCNPACPATFLIERLNTQEQTQEHHSKLAGFNNHLSTDHAAQTAHQSASPSRTL
jgi:hypothetical protein